MLYDYFPPEQIPPTHSNAKSLDLINYFKNNDENRSDNIIISNYRDINQTRNELSKDDIAHLLRRTTFGARIEDIQQTYELGLNSTLNLLLQKMKSQFLSLIGFIIIIILILAS